MNFKEPLIGLALLVLLAITVVVAFSHEPSQAHRPNAITVTRSLSPDLLAASPEGTVVRAFTAYQNEDAKGINNELSPQGYASADFFCRGQAAACLVENYGRLGNNLTANVSLARETETSATVVLKTTWKGYASPLCQDYAVDNTDAGWRITYFDNPRHC